MAVIATHSAAFWSKAPPARQGAAARQSFDLPTARYIEFEFDTGCGEVIELTAITSSVEGTELSGLANRAYCTR